MKVYRNIITWLWPDFKNKRSETKKLANNSPRPCLTFLGKGFCWKFLGSLRFLRHEPHISLFSSVQSLSCVRLFMTPWITASQASLSITNSWSSLVLLLLSRFSCVQLCATPETAAHQAPPSLGFLRQEHWTPCCYWTRISFSKTEQYSRECTYHILFIHSFANRFFDYFHLLWLCIILLWTFGIQALTFNFFLVYTQKWNCWISLCFKKIFHSTVKQLFSIITSVNKIVM